MSDYPLVHPYTPEQLATYHESKQTALYATLITLLILSDIIIITKVWGNLSRHWRQKGILAEDVFIVASGILLTAIFIILIDATHHGLGLHTWRVNTEDAQWPSNLVHVFRDSWITMVLMCSFFTCVKLSLLFFYKRLFLVSNEWLRIAWWVNFVYIILWFIGGTGFYIFQCSPSPWYWLQFYAKYDIPAPGGVHGSCTSRTPQHVSMPMMFSLVSDVAILLLPLGCIAKLGVTRKKKFGLLLIFGVGTGACALELARIIQLNVGTDDSGDPCYGTAIFFILTASEETAAVVCACLPVIVAHLSRYLSERHPSDGPGGGGYYGSGSHRAARGSRASAHFLRITGDGDKHLRSGDSETLVSPGNVYFPGGGGADGKQIPLQVVAPVGIARSDSIRNDSDSDSATLQVRAQSVPRAGFGGDIHVKTDIEVNVTGPPPHPRK